MLKRVIFIKIFVFALILHSKAQSNNAPSDYNPHDLKITGYFQFQYQKAQERGESTLAGGDFLKEVDERFDRAKGAFLRAIDARDFFISAARQKLRVKFSFEDGVAKFVSNDASFSTGRGS